MVVKKVIDREHAHSTAAAIGWWYGGQRRTTQYPKGSPILCVMGIYPGSSLRLAPLLTAEGCPEYGGRLGVVE
jgi:hypothetical protein